MTLFASIRVHSWFSPLVSIRGSAMTTCGDDEQAAEGKEDYAIRPLGKKYSKSREKFLLEFRTGCFIRQSLQIGP